VFFVLIHDYKINTAFEKMIMYLTFFCSKPSYSCSRLTKSYIEHLINPKPYLFCTFACSLVILHTGILRSRSIFRDAQHTVHDAQ